MALLQCNFFSKSLMRTVPIQAIIPTDKIIPGNQEAEKPFKTLYLLHGIFGNYTDWVNSTRIQSWAQDRNLAVIMPSGDNKFYVDSNNPGEKYGTFIHEELVEFTRRTFPLSRNREDTFIGGLSMGGFGSLINGLKAPETFGAICALSSALILERAVETTEYTDSVFTSKGYYELVFGDLKKLMGSDKDPKAAAKRIVDEGKPTPKIFMACGTEDDLMDANRSFKDYLISLGYDLTWIEDRGVHDWIFWDAYIKKALDWLPTDNENQGISSGNVR